MNDFHGMKFSRVDDLPASVVLVVPSLPPRPNETLLAHQERLARAAIRIVNVGAAVDTSER